MRVCETRVHVGLAEIGVLMRRQAVKDNYFTENRKLTDLNKEVTDLETRLQQDFGTEGQFAALADR